MVFHSVLFLVLECLSFFFLADFMSGTPLLNSTCYCDALGAGPRAAVCLLAGCLRGHSSGATDLTCRICKDKVHGTVYRGGEVTWMDLSIFVARANGESGPCLAPKIISCFLFLFLIHILSIVAVSESHSLEKNIYGISWPINMFLGATWLTVFIRLCTRNGEKLCCGLWKKGMWPLVRTNCRWVLCCQSRQWEDNGDTQQTYVTNYPPPHAAVCTFLSSWSAISFWECQIQTKRAAEDRGRASVILSSRRCGQTQRRDDGTALHIYW